VDKDAFKKIMREIPEDIRNQIEQCKNINKQIKVVTATKIKDTKLFKDGDINKNIQSKIYDDFTDF